MRGPPYILKNKVHTHIHEICVYDLSLLLSLSDCMGWVCICYSLLLAVRE